MPIQVEHEDVDALRAWGMGLEKTQEECHFCGADTRFWHVATNTPVCRGCAAEHEASDLPSRPETPGSAAAAVHGAESHRHHPGSLSCVG